jgi:glycosyltransferase involved in cell wall biosynthesis
VKSPLKFDLSFKSLPRGNLRIPLHKSVTEDWSPRPLSYQERSQTEKPVACLSVAIATLNRPDKLSRCLNSVLAGKVLPAEVIVVDQSQDELTRRAVEQNISDWQRAAPDKSSIVYLRQQVRGVSASRNLAFSHARFSVVAVTDDDCVVDQTWISAIDQVFNGPDPPTAMGGRVLPLGEATPNSFAVSLRTSQIPVEFSGKVAPWVVGTGGNFAVARDWWQRVANYDERLGPGSPGRAAEDMDLIYKLLRAGATIQYNPNAIVYHERQTQSRRLEAWASYSYGIGSFCGKWLRHGDPYALWILGQWFAWHGKRLVLAMVQQQNSEVPQRALTLKGTLLGLVHGLRKFRSDH